MEQLSWNPSGSNYYRNDNTHESIKPDCLETSLGIPYARRSVFYPRENLAREIDAYGRNAATWKQVTRDGARVTWSRVIDIDETFRRLIHFPRALSSIPFKHFRCNPEFSCSSQCDRGSLRALMSQSRDLWTFQMFLSHFHTRDQLTGWRIHIPWKEYLRFFRFTQSYSCFPYLREVLSAQLDLDAGNNIRPPIWMRFKDACLLYVTRPRGRNNIARV